MELNDYMTGKIPVTGEGFHKTYEESVIRLVKYNDRLLNSYRNQVFLQIDTGEIYVPWGEEDYKRMISNSENFKKIEIINVLILNNGILIEFIEPNILKMHLQEEARLLRENDTLKLV